VVVFPETWLPGYPVWIDAAPGAALWDDPGAKALYRLLVRNSISLGGVEFARLQAAAERHGVVVVIGAHERHGATLYNTMLTFDGDGGHRIHRKLTPTYTERLLWGAGDGSTLETTETPLGTIGGLICWEHWMPLARAAMHAKHELLHVAQWPWVRELHQICSRQYAFEGQCFVAASGCSMTRGDMLEGFETIAADEPAARELLHSIPGDDATLMLQGGSCVIGPDAQVLASAEPGSTATLYAEVDPAAAEEGRMYLDTDGHYSRPDIFKLEVDRRPRLNVVAGPADGEEG
jgi:predicted amidohydrolase